jgi:anti-sigma-K factor RskA
MKQEHPENLLAGYALGCLDGEDYLLVKAHLQNCGECRAELRGFKEITAQLAYAVPTVTPAPSLVPRKGRSPQQANTYSWFKTLLDFWPRLVPVATLAAFILVALLGVTDLLLWRQLENTKQPGLEKVQLVHLKATEQNPAASGTLLVRSADQQALLEVNGLKPLQESAQYQLWLIKDGKRSSGGVFSVDNDGRARLQIDATNPLDHYDAFGITIEPFGGSPGPTGPKVLGGKFPT